MSTILGAVLGRSSEERTPVNKKRQSRGQIAADTRGAEFSAEFSAEVTLGGELEGMGRQGMERCLRSPGGRKARRVRGTVEAEASEKRWKRLAQSLGKSIISPQEGQRL